MKHGLLLISLFIAATALTSGEYSSAFQPSSPSNTTTPASNTTTPAANTTTPAANTTTHAPNTTTQAPNTTTPIPAPTPPTNMTKGSYNVSLNGVICILADMAIGIRVNTSEVNGTFIVQPAKTTASGECTDKTVIMNLYFGEGVISFKFIKNDTTQKVYAEYVNVDLTYAFKTGVSKEYSGTNRSIELFAVDSGHSYSCTSQTLYMGNGVSLDLTKNRIQAFVKNNQFGIPDLCKADQPDYRVPIAVGIILIILIVIVVIAYLISRKRRTDGYQSL